VVVVTNFVEVYLGRPKTFFMVDGGGDNRILYHFYGSKLKSLGFKTFLWSTEGEIIGYYIIFMAQNSKVWVCKVQF
jgi:hypothetical protein